MLKRVLLLAAALLFVAGVAAPVGRLLLSRAPVRVEAARRGKAVGTVFATGYVEARERRILRAHRAGVVSAVRAHETAEVKAGDAVLALRDSGRKSRRDRVAADLELVERDLAPDSAFRRGADARIAEAAENARFAREEHERRRPLLAGGHVAESVLHELEARAKALAEAERGLREARLQDLEALEARRRKLKAEMEGIDAEEGDDLLRSPIDGVVMSLAVEEGEAAGIERDLAKVGDIRDLIVEADVAEEDIARVRVGQEAVIRLPGAAAAARGAVFEILPDAERQTKSFRVKVRFTGGRFEPDPASPKGLSGRTRLPEGLEAFSGMSAELGIVVEERPDALIVPRSAVTVRGTVFVVEGGRARERPVRLGVSNFEVCEILDGLREGEVVAASGILDLSDGARVAPQAEGDAPP